MYEVEVKVPANLGEVRERLDAIEATSFGRIVQSDTYYDAPHRSFPETDEALRIRRERGPDGQSVARLTYKGPLIDDGSKTREEFETVVEDDDAVAAILGNLGFARAATVRKERERYGVDGYTVTLDSVEGVGEYVEVEVEIDVSGTDGAVPDGSTRATRTGADDDLSTVADDDPSTVADRSPISDASTTDDAAAIEQAREGAFDLLDRLGLDPNDQVRVSYLELQLSQ